MKKYNISLFGSGGEITMGELENREDFNEDEYYEFDNLHHSYSSGVDSTIVVTDLSNNSEMLNISFSDYNAKYGEDLVDFKEVLIESAKLIVCCLSREKGTIFSGYFEIKDSESFKITNLKMEISYIIFGDYEEERITNISYKNISIINEDTNAWGHLTVEFIG